MTHPSRERVALSEIVALVYDALSFLERVKFPEPHPADTITSEREARRLAAEAVSWAREKMECIFVLASNRTTTALECARRYEMLAALSIRSDKEQTELATLLARLRAEGLEPSALPVPREDIPSYPRYIFAPTAEEVDMYPVLAEVANMPEREAVLALAERVMSARIENTHAAQPGEETCDGDGSWAQGGTRS